MDNQQPIENPHPSEENPIKKMLKRKPKLKIMPNHIKVTPPVGRVWSSAFMGQAIRDGHGWYKPKGAKQ